HPLTVLHPEIEELARAFTIDKDTRDHQRSEKIALPAFVHAKMRLKHFRRMHLFVAEPSFTENLRFENELCEILHPAPLHQNLWTFLINGHAQLFLLRKKNRVRLRRKGESAVLRAWEGLGYYARARNLHRCAKIIFGKLSGKFPNGPDALRSLPGIGRYTANAIAVFAFNKSLPIVEANTARVLTRLFNIRAPIDSTHGRQELWKLSAKLVPQNRARDFQNTMMDLGTLICTANNPHCQICPVKKFCRARDPASLPR